MTCIVAQKTTTGVLLAAETTFSDGPRLLRRATPKLWNVTPRIAIGTAGSCRCGDLLRGFDKWPEPGVGPDEFGLALGRSLRELLKEEIKNHNVWALVAMDREIYYVGSDGSVSRQDAAYSALGSGELVALGALFVLERVRRTEHGPGALPTPTHETKACLITALGAACEHVEGLRGPYTFAETIAP
jgi:20S proteasome alpha/beta subunit